VDGRPLSLHMACSEPRPSVDLPDVLAALQAAAYPAIFEVQWALRTQEAAAPAASGKAALDCASAAEAERFVGRLHAAFEERVSAPVGRGEERAVARPGSASPPATQTATAALMELAASRRQQLPSRGIGHSGSGAALLEPTSRSVSPSQQRAAATVAAGVRPVVPGTALGGLATVATPVLAPGAFAIGQVVPPGSQHSASSSRLPRPPLSARVPVASAAVPQVFSPPPFSARMPLVSAPGPQVYSPAYPAPCLHPSGGSGLLFQAPGVAPPPHRWSSAPPRAQSPPHMRVQSPPSGCGMQCLQGPPTASVQFTPVVAPGVVPTALTARAPSPVPSVPGRFTNTLVAPNGCNGRLLAHTPVLSPPKGVQHRRRPHVEMPGPGKAMQPSSATEASRREVSGESEEESSRQLREEPSRATPAEHPSAGGGDTRASSSSAATAFPSSLAAWQAEHGGRACAVGGALSAWAAENISSPRSPPKQTVSDAKRDAVAIAEQIYSKALAQGGQKSSPERTTGSSNVMKRIEEFRRELKEGATT